MSITVHFNGTDYKIPTMGESADWGDELNAYLIALGTFAGGATYVTETFTTGDNVEDSFPRALTLNAGVIPRCLLTAQVTAGDGSPSVSGGWPTWTFSAPTISVAFLPGLSANTSYTIVWRVET